MTELPDNKREFKSMMLAASTAIICVWIAYFGAGLVGKKLETQDAVTHIRATHPGTTIELLRVTEAPCASERPLYEVSIEQPDGSERIARFGPNRLGVMSAFVEAQRSECGVYLPL